MVFLVIWSFEVGNPYTLRKSLLIAPQSFTCSSSLNNSPFPSLRNGVEISVSWRSQTLHILRRGIDPKYSQLAEGLASIPRGRAERAGKMLRNWINLASTAA